MDGHRLLNPVVPGQVRRHIGVPAATVYGVAVAAATVYVAPAATVYVAPAEPGAPPGTLLVVPIMGDVAREHRTPSNIAARWPMFLVVAKTLPAALLLVAANECGRFNPAAAHLLRRDAENWWGRDVPEARAIIQNLLCDHGYARLPLDLRDTLEEREPLAQDVLARGWVAGEHAPWFEAITAIDAAVIGELIRARRHACLSVLGICRNLAVKGAHASITAEEVETSVATLLKARILRVNAVPFSKPDDGVYYGLASSPTLAEQMAIVQKVDAEGETEVGRLRAALAQARDWIRDEVEPGRRADATTGRAIWRALDEMIGAGGPVPDELARLRDEAQRALRTTCDVTVAWDEERTARQKAEAALDAARREVDGAREAFRTDNAQWTMLRGVAGAADGQGILHRVQELLCAEGDMDAWQRSALDMEALWRGARASLRAIEAHRDELDREVVAARAKVVELRRQFTFAQANNHARNVALDALHFVWCDGGCNGGVHRYDGAGPTAITLELVESAVRNTQRLVTWYRNHRHRQGLPDVDGLVAPKGP